MKTMRRPRFDILRKLLMTWVCALLFANGIPTLAFATESNPETDASTKDASDTTYHLVAGSVQANPPSYFYLIAEANGYSRSAKVSFVDADKNPLNGIVTENLTRSYTGTGPESNETNTIDMYQFQNMLNPEIADEYDFSRVYVQLKQGAGNQEDFRYLQVGDETAVSSSGNTSLYRGYLYQTSIDECKPDQDYQDHHGTWYNLEAGGDIDPIFIEFNHVAEASFNALDTRDDPVEGAQFALYSDSRCFTPYEYKSKPVVATSNKRGLVSFGKIPQGTYYMKETVVPDSYKASTHVYTVVVDGHTPIADVVHQDDDGSVLITDAKKATITKEWDDGGKSHVGDSVEVTVFEEEAALDTVTLSAENDWSATLDNLDPNKTYMITESKVIVDGKEVTSDWIPRTTIEEKDSTTEYYKVDALQNGKQYILLTPIQNGAQIRALAGDNSKLTTLPLEVRNGAIEGNVSTDMLWTVDRTAQDGIISLFNDETKKYLDHNNTSNWFLNTEAPLYVRQMNNEGTLSICHRANLNSTTPHYLHVWSTDGHIDRTTEASDATSFDIYRKVDVKTLDITMTNKTTSYPVQFKNVTYPDKTALPGMKFDLYTQKVYDAVNHGVAIQQSLVADSDGILKTPDGKSTFELSADSYCLVQSGGLDDYPPLEQPVRFTITRGGALQVLQACQEVHDFTYSSTTADGKLLLQIPHFKSATVELLFQVQGDYANLTKEFEFQLAIPEGMSEIEAFIDDTPVTISAEDDTVALSHGQSLKLANVPDSESYELTQMDTSVARSPNANGGCYNPQLQVITADTVKATLKHNDARVLTLSELKGTQANPAKVTITNTLQNSEVPITGIGNDDSPWLAMVLASATAFSVMCALWLLRKRQAYTE